MSSAVLLMNVSPPHGEQVIVFLVLFVLVLAWALYVASDGYQATQLRKRGYQAVNTRLNPTE